MTLISIIDPEEFAAVKRELAEVKAIMQAYVTSYEEWLPTDQALKASGIKTRQTLVTYARATSPGQQQQGRITYRKEGTKCLYSRSSCIDYAQRKLGQPALAA